MNNSPKPLTVYVFNVGQGDHLLIEFPNGEYGIIDFYHSEAGPVSHLRPPALSYLESVHSKRRSKPIRIRFAHITHPDLDHTKGVEEFLRWAIRNKVKVREFWLFAGLDFKQVVDRYKKALASLPDPDPDLMARAEEVHDRLKTTHGLIKKLRCDQKAVVGVGQIAKIGDAPVVAIAPLPTHIGDLNGKVLDKLFTMFLRDKVTSTSYNNLMSSVLMIKHGPHTLLFGGDTGNAVWRDCLRYYRSTKQPHGDCRGTFVKVSHHGSKHSSSIDLWRKLLCDDSRLAISAGRTKRPNHPDRETLKHILRAGKKFTHRPQIVSTNMCSKCLDSKDAEVVDWFSPSEDEPPYEVKLMNGVMRAKRVRPKTPPPAFAGYIYRFGHEPNDSPILKRAFTKSPLHRSSCLFEEGTNKRSNKRFPLCMYRRD